MSHFLQYHDRAWGLIRTSKQSEKYVCAYFMENKLPCYLPWMRQVVSKYRSFRRVMFPCYLFAAWGDQDYQLVKNCHHISHLIQSEINADEDIIEQMENIYRIEQLSEIGDIPLTKTSFNQSKLIKIHRGPLKGMRGHWVNSSNGQSQFNVCLNIVGTHYEIAFDKEFVYRNVDAIAV